MTFDLSRQLVSNAVRGRFITQHMAELHRFVCYVHTYIYETHVAFTMNKKSLCTSDFGVGR